MKVKELINQLKKIPQNKDVVITSMDDYFSCNDFIVHSYDNKTDTYKEAIEIILPYYFENYTKEKSE